MTQCAPPPLCDLDDEYYWDFVTFSAQERLFRVPKFRLISESEEFSRIYALDGHDNGSDSEYGTIEDPRLNAVQLDDVNADEFRSFLKAVYPKAMLGYLALSKDEWLSVLKLSTRWLFNDLRKMAIEELARSDLDPIEKIQLGKQYSVETWLLSGCHELISRDAVISIEDAEKINWKVAINLYIIRDGVKTDPLANLHAIDDHVQSVFSADFEKIVSSRSMYLTTEEKSRETREEEERKEEMEKRERESEEVARREAESQRREALAAEEEKRITELALELDNRRRQLHSFVTTPTKASAADISTSKGPHALPFPDLLHTVDTASVSGANAPSPEGEDTGGTCVPPEETAKQANRREKIARQRASRKEARVAGAPRDAQAIDVQVIPTAAEVSEQPEQKAKSQAASETPLRVLSASDVLTTSTSAFTPQSPDSPKVSLWSGPPTPLPPSHPPLSTWPPVKAPTLWSPAPSVTIQKGELGRNVSSLWG